MCWPAPACSTLPPAQGRPTSEVAMAVGPGLTRADRRERGSAVTWRLPAAVGPSSVSVFSSHSTNTRRTSRTLPLSRGKTAPVVGSSGGSTCISPPARTRGYGRPRPRPRPRAGRTARQPTWGGRPDSGNPQDGPCPAGATGGGPERCRPRKVGALDLVADERTSRRPFRSVGYEPDQIVGEPDAVAEGPDAGAGWAALLPLSRLAMSGHA